MPTVLLRMCKDVCIFSTCFDLLASVCVSSLVCLGLVASQGGRQRGPTGALEVKPEAEEELMSLCLSKSVKQA